MGGGIVGVAFGNSEISNCVNKINVTKLSSNRDVAGIVGAVDQIDGNETVVTIKNCINYGNITAILSAQINSVEDDVTLLKQKVKDLETRLSKYEDVK